MSWRVSLNPKRRMYWLQEGSERKMMIYLRLFKGISIRQDRSRVSPKLGVNTD